MITGFGCLFFFVLFIHRGEILVCFSIIMCVPDFYSATNKSWYYYYLVFQFGHTLFHISSVGADLLFIL